MIIIIKNTQFDSQKYKTLSQSVYIIVKTCLCRPRKSWLLFGTSYWAYKELIMARLLKHMRAIVYSADVFKGCTQQRIYDNIESLVVDD